MWISEDLTPLGNMPAYEDLIEEQRLRYNQYYAIEMAEQFIWLERYCIIAPLQRLLRGEMPTPSLRTLLESFVADEKLHNASLRRLLVLACPDLYEKPPFYFFVPPWKAAWYRFAIWPTPSIRIIRYKSVFSPPRCVPGVK